MGNSLYRVENWRTRAVNPHVHGELDLGPAYPAKIEG